MWRYPVKSMQGERVEVARVSPSGLEGDREWAVLDLETGLVASAKHPRLWAALLGCRSSLHFDGEFVAIELPGGGRVVSEAPTTANAALSDLVRRRVELRRRPDLDGGTIERTDPLLDGPDDLDGPGPLGLDDIASFELGSTVPGSLFDFAVAHVVSMATLDALAGHVDASRDEIRARLRPNFVVDLDIDPFDEHVWTDGELHIGDLACDVVLPTPRCIVPTLAQRGFDTSPGVARSLARLNRIEVPGFGRLPVAGAYLSPRGSAEVRVGDPVMVRRR